MKTAIFHNPADIRYDTVPDLRIELATDVILKVTSTAVMLPYIKNACGAY